MEYDSQGKMPLGIYLHIPFCIKKCDYCDFLSGPAEPELRRAYVRALIQEIRMYRNSDYLVKTVFFGGGTPSVLSGQAIGEIMAVVRECFCLDADAEISLEANPGTVTEEKLACWKEAGVNRLSFGLQSADNRELKLLGRIHTYEQFLESWEMADRAGYRNRNIDLMSALPGQTVGSWERTLKTVAALGPEHLSAYSLIIEEGTPFYRRFAGPECPDFSLLPDEEEEREMYGLTCRELGKYGYHRYEISNYALPGFVCRHNCGYWEGVPYLGFGSGASSYIIEGTDGKEKQGKSEGTGKTEQTVETKIGRNTKQKVVRKGDRQAVRRQNIRDTAEYIRRMNAVVSPVEERTELTMENQMEEFVFLGLRMEKGISFRRFRQRFGRPFFQVYGTVTGQLKAQGLLEETRDGIWLTEYGIDVSNYVFEAYLLS